MGKGSGRRPSAVSEAELEKAWNSIFAGHPTEEQFEQVRGKTVLTKASVDDELEIKRQLQEDKEEALDSALADWGGRTEDDYGNELPKSMADKEKPPNPHGPKDPDRFYDDTGDA